MKLLVIGNSPKLIRFVESIFQIDDMRIVSWRSLPLTEDEQKDIAKTHWDLLLVSGYNYQTASCGFEECLAKNVHNVVALATACVDRAACVIYANTKAPVKKYTWSRYLFVKMLLGQKLASVFPNAVVLEFPTILESGVISTTGGALSNIAFKFLDVLGLLSKVTINQSEEANRKLFCDLQADPIVPKAVFLGFPRPHILDRFLRLIFG